MRSIVFCVALILAMAGCSSEEAPPEQMQGTTETVSAPVRPSGPSVVSVGVSNTFTSGGALSTEGHPVEYQFDLNADGGGNLTAWTRSSLTMITWAVPGVAVLRVRARCEVHPSVESEWSLTKSVEIGLGPDTELTSVINRYFVGGQEMTRIIDVTDSEPDTVPYNSWIQLYYRGIPSTQGDSLCADEINECLRYQVNYSWESVRNPGIVNTIAWRPFDPSDTDLTSDIDSASVNIGTVEYILRARTVDQFDRSDMSPAEIEIVGNFPPSLDTQAIIDQDGATVAEADTVVWDWWQPANAPDTIDTSVTTEVIVVKRFYFVARATGHDHPMDPPEGIQSWLYRFLRVGSNPPVYESFRSRAGQFVDTDTANLLSDTVSVEFRYSDSADPGGASILANLPDYLNRDYEYSVVGRDLSVVDRFNQYMWVDGGQIQLNSYFAAPYARWTSEGLRRFHLKLVY